MASRTALVLEDTDANRIFFERLLTQAGYEVISASTGREAFALTSGLADLPLAVVDMQMPDISGLDMTARLRHQFPDSCIIVATMHDEYSLIASAVERGCNVFLVKPHGFMELFKRLTSGGEKGLIAEGPLVIDQYGPRPFQVSAT